MSEGDRYIGLTILELRDVREQAERAEAAAERAMSANSRQVGGSHYGGGGEQHWDVVDKFGVPYLEGVGSKYPLRWREKGGVEDLEKTLHYIDKILESPDYHSRWSRPKTTNLVEATTALVERHNCGPIESRVVRTLLQGFSRAHLRNVREELSCYVLSLRSARPGTPEDGGHHARQETPAENSGPSPITIVMSPGSRGDIRMVGGVAMINWVPASTPEDGGHHARQTEPATDLRVAGDTTLLAMVGDAALLRDGHRLLLIGPSGQSRVVT